MYYNSDKVNVKMEEPHTLMQKLELEHADAAGLEDIEISKTLTTTQGDLASTGYFYDIRVIDTIAGISISTVASYWGFSPAASILLYINEDIGKSRRDTSPLGPISVLNANRS